MPLKRKILSIGSGRCANEVLQREEGYDIQCSDLDFPECLDATRALFLGLPFERRDIIKDQPKETFDALIGLSMASIFNDYELDLSFNNASASIKPSWRFIIDSAAVSDNIYAYLLHDIDLRLEAYWLAAWRTLRDRRRHVVYRTCHGFRRTDAEVAAAAQRHGLTRIEHMDGGELIDFYRGALLPRLLQSSRFLRRLFKRIGRRTP